MTGFYTGDVRSLDFITKIWVQIYNQNEELSHVERQFIPTCSKYRVEVNVDPETLRAERFRSSKHISDGRKRLGNKRKGNVNKYLRN